MSVTARNRWAQPLHLIHRTNSGRWNIEKSSQGPFSLLFPASRRVIDARIGTERRFYCALLHALIANIIKEKDLRQRNTLNGPNSVHLPWLTFSNSRISVLATTLRCSIGTLSTLFRFHRLRYLSTQRLSIHFEILYFPPVPEPGISLWKIIIVSLDNSATYFGADGNVKGKRPIAWKIKTRGCRDESFPSRSVECTRIAA